ncbi:MAG: SGNH/GDSL hydrolase family protein [Chitinophagaceae bacterium]|nr:SGNH/GDSL hydrolase family protein [Chitinophagaceae bacterium]
MKQLATVFVLLWTLHGSGQKTFTSYKKILFIGNSITYDGTFISGIETWLRLKYPEARFEIINAGLPSETVSGLSEAGHADNRFPRPDLHERLARVLSLVKPDVVLASYGINDGIYMPFDENRFEQYKQGIYWLHKEVVKSGADIVHISAPCYDERRAGNAGYENTMDRYAAWLTGLKDSGWAVIDVYHPMQKYLMAHRAVDEQFHLDGFELARDGVHPNANAHWLMARIILTAMNENGADTISSIQSFVSGFRNGMAILDKIAEKQTIMKDAWLTAAGHKRPEMKKGLPLVEARKKEKALDKVIDSLNRTR